MSSYDTASRGFAPDVIPINTSPHWIENKQTTLEASTSPYVMCMSICFVFHPLRRIVVSSWAIHRHCKTCMDLP